MDDLEQLQSYLSESTNIVFFGGAGVSTESNIPDFRSEKGFYQTQQEFGHPPESMLSHTFFKRRTPEFFRFYRSMMLYPDARPNPAHLALAWLEELGKLKGVITQNIDGLHQAAGSQNVQELHGSVHRNFCMQCGEFHDLDYVIKSEDDVPQCRRCGGVIKPDVVLYEEGLDNGVINRSIKLISQADVLIVGGTSLAVYPAAGLIDYYQGNKLVLINLSPTSYDTKANLLIKEQVGEVLAKAVIAPLPLRQRSHLS